HAGAGNNPSLAVLELGQCVGQILTCWISRARVVVQPLFSESLESERRREVHRRHHRTVVQVSSNSSAHSARCRLTGWPGRCRSDLVAHDTTSASTLSNSLMKGAMRGQSPRNASWPSKESSSISWLGPLSLRASSRD